MVCYGVGPGPGAMSWRLERIHSWRMRMRRRRRRMRSCKRCGRPTRATPR